MSDFEEAFGLVKKFFDGDHHKAMLWMVEKNPMLGGVSPREMLFIGRGDKLLQFIKEALSENEPGK